MFIESCKHCGEVFASVKAKSSHFQECSSLLHDEVDTIEEHSEVPSESKVDATIIDIPKKKEKRLKKCLYCGQSFGNGFELRHHHLKSCQKLADNVDVGQRKCRHCQVIIEGSFKYHFSSAHTDFDFVKENRTKPEKREKRYEKTKCSFCGLSLVVYDKDFMFHYRICEVFNKYLDITKKSCKLCDTQIPQYVPHFRSFHPNLLDEIPEGKAQKQQTKSCVTACPFCGDKITAIVGSFARVHFQDCDVAKKHINPENRSCLECGKAFIWRNMTTHFRRVHPELLVAKNKVKKAKAIKTLKKCVFCEESVDSFKLTHHYFNDCKMFDQYVDKASRKCLSCELPMKKFFRKHFLRQNSSIFCKEWKSSNACFFCSKLFSKPKYARIHSKNKCKEAKKHVDFDQLKCRLCNQTINKKGFIIHFMRKHSDFEFSKYESKLRKAYYCHFCGTEDQHKLTTEHRKNCSKFQQNVDMKLMKCRHCDYTFTPKQHCHLHFRISHPDMIYEKKHGQIKLPKPRVKPYYCHFCGTKSQQNGVEHRKKCSKFLQHVDFEQKKCRHCEYSFQIAKGKRYYQHFRVCHPQLIFDKFKGKLVIYRGAPCISEQCQLCFKYNHPTTSMRKHLKVCKGREPAKVKQVKKEARVVLTRLPERIVQKPLLRKMSQDPFLDIKPIEAGQMYPTDEVEETFDDKKPLATLLNTNMVVVKEEKSELDTKLGSEMLFETRDCSFCGKSVLIRDKDFASHYFNDCEVFK